MTRGKLKINYRAFDEIVGKIVVDECVPRMQRVADACNADAGTETRSAIAESDGPGYRVSVEGDDPLRKRDYHATVITATGAAIRDNAEHQRLVNNLHLAGGA